MGGRVPEEPAEPAPQASPLPQIPGLDTAAGLRRAGHKEELYLWLLKRFLTDNADTADQIGTAMAAGHWEEAQRLAHTVKGLLGSMGAAEAQRHAELLEEALKGHQADWRDLLPPFTGALAPLLEALREYFPPEADLAEEAPEAAAAPADLPSWLTEFTALCAEGDFKANELWDGGKGGLAGLVPAASLRKVSAALNDFDYEGARAETLAFLGTPTGPGLEGA